jgi:lon-related putative ATP-dependent protease
MSIPGSPPALLAATRFELPPEQLRRHLDPATLPFQTTADVVPLQGTVGQPRALDALEFGLEIGTAGYNLFVVGAPGSGRLSTVRDHLERVARERPVPGDWVYVHDFTQPDRPRAIGLPAGWGRGLARDVEELVQTAQREIGRSLESEEYQKRRTALVAEVERDVQALRAEIEAFAAARGFQLRFLPTGIALVPLLEGHTVTPEQAEQLSAEQRAELETRSQEIHGELQNEGRRLRRVERAGAERLAELERDTAAAAIASALNGLAEKYAAHPAVLEYLKAVQEDVPQHLAEFREHPQAGALDEQATLADLLGATPRAAPSTRYRVNVLVDNGGIDAAPVVIERNPTYYNLTGRIEYRPQLGSMVTDFTQIRAGSLHRANGGFLVVEVLDLLSQPFAWEGLKRALRAREVTMENLAEQLSFVPTAGLRPQPIPLDVKVVLIGTPLLHMLLYARDEELRELFKVKVEFAPDMEWTDEHVLSYAAYMRRWIEQAGLRHFDRGAVARVVEQGSRLREDQRKLSTRLLDVSDLVTEASFWAGKAGRDVVTAADVDQAVSKKDDRSSLLEDRMREMVDRRTIVIDTEGARTGQLNGLTVLELGDHSFGQPVRITATTSLGRGSIESIERQVELSGPIHSKGVLILSGYLAEQYAQDWPLALRATLTFEQSYDEVEGDSASSAELYALLSALSGVPIAQGLAVTGSVNQHGEVQAVGGVTRKVEGFFHVCRQRGLTGTQGVVIPAANVASLMLDDEVVQAVREGRFHVHAVRTVDEAIELLSGTPAGERRPDGGYPEGTVHRLVADRLQAYAERLRGFAESPNGSVRGHNGPPLELGKG